VTWFSQSGMMPISLEEYFASVERVASVNIPYAYEVEIYLCKRPKGTLDQLWPTLRRFI